MQMEFLVLLDNVKLISSWILELVNVLNKDF